mmetsp:Transcript_36650/g.101813  ORF Transcript_36650/g.101813 Transcript_36650/m.101813 type:complete len:288 (-) Transcript_36650:59-922(-)
MNKIFNCCHGMFETQVNHWICSTHSSDSGPVDEEIIGSEGQTYNSHLLIGEENAKFARPGSLRGGPPMPVGGPGGPEDKNETAKQRLQRLIRDFAHDAVGPGVLVEAQCQAFAGQPFAANDGIVEAKLRMDRKLSRIELWCPTSPDGSAQGEQVLLKVPLQQVQQITKRSSGEGDVAEADGAAGGARTEAATMEGPMAAESRSRQVGPTSTSALRSGATLSITRRPTAAGPTPDLRLTFESSMVHDRAYTCLRIFQMSVTQALDGGHGREADSDGTGYDSSGAASPC